MHHAHLFVGFGGSGGKTLAELGRLISLDPFWSIRASRECYFLLVDTDAGDLEKSQSDLAHALSNRISPPRIITFRLSDNISSFARTIGADLESQRWQDEDWQSIRRAWWFNEDDQPFVAANAGNPSTGASQCPPLSYYLAWKSMRRFENTIQSLYHEMQVQAGDSADNLHVTVTMVGSLAGGTGRGCWAPLSLKVNEVITRNNSSSGKPCGFFFDASVFSSVLKASAEQARQIRVNSLTGISEITAWLQNNARGSKRREFWLPSLDAPAAREQALIDLERCYIYTHEHTATPVQEAWIIFKEGPSGAISNEKAAYQMTATGLYARLVQSQIASQDNNVRRHMAGVATAIYTVDAERLTNYLSLHARSRVPAMIAQPITDDSVQAAIERSLPRALRFPRSEEMMKAISEPLANVCRQSSAYVQFMAAMPNPNREADADQNKDEALERAKHFDGKGGKLSEEQAGLVGSELLKRLCGGRSVSELIRATILDKTLSLRGAAQIAEALSGKLRESAKSLAADWLKDASKALSASAVTSLHAATDERSDLETSRWKVWGKKVFFSSDEIEELQRIATELYFRTNSPLVCRKLAEALDAASTTAQTIAKRLTQGLDRLNSKATKELEEARKIAKQAFVSPSRNYKPQGFQPGQNTRRVLPPVVDESTLERELDSVLSDINSQPESFRSTREELINYVWSYAMGTTQATAADFDAEVQRYLGSLGEQANVPFKFLSDRFSLAPTAQALAKLLVDQMNEADERRQNDLRTEYEALFGSKPVKKSGKWAEPDLNDLFAGMTISLARVCDPFVLFRQELPDTKDRVQVFLPQGFDESFANFVKQKAGMPLLNVCASREVAEEDSDLRNMAGASPFSMVAIADQTIEIEPLDRKPNHLGAVRNLDYQNNPEVRDWLRAAEDPSGQSLFRRRTDTCGFGYTWPAFVSDAEWVKLRWRPWQPATLGGEKHVQAILWALAGAVPDLRKRSCNLAIDAMNKVRAENPEWIMPLLTVQRQGNGFAWVFGRNAASERKIEGGSKIYFDGNQFGPGSNADSFSSVKKLVDFMSKNAAVVNAILKERALFEKALDEADDDLSEQMVKKIHRQLMQGVEEFLIRERLRTEKLGTSDTLLPIIEGLHASCAQQV